MEKEYQQNDLYVILPSKMDETKDKFIQNPSNISIAIKLENYNYIDLISKEEIFVFKRDELIENNKYINVFRNDCVFYKNFIYSMRTDYIKDIDTYKKIIFNNKEEINQQEIEEIINFLKLEAYNIYYNKTRKISKPKKRTRKK